MFRLQRTGDRTVEERKGDRNESQTVLRACEVLKAFRNPGEELVLADVVHRAQLFSLSCLDIHR